MVCFLWMIQTLLNFESEKSCQLLWSWWLTLDKRSKRWQEYVLWPNINKYITFVLSLSFLATCLIFFFFCLQFSLGIWSLKYHILFGKSVHVSVYLMMLYETNEKWKNKIQQQRQKIKISSVTIIKTANKWKHFSHLSVSFLCPPNATTVWIAARTSSATAPAFAYAVSSLLVNAEIICVEEKSFNFPVQTKTEPAQSLYWFIWMTFFFFTEFPIYFLYF